MGNSHAGQEPKKLQPLNIEVLRNQSRRNLTHQDSGQSDEKKRTNAKILERRFLSSQESDSNPDSPVSASPIYAVDFAPREIACDYGPTITLGSKDRQSPDAQILWKYDVLELLGGGTYSQVMLCRKLVTKPLARKLLRQHSSGAKSSPRTTSLELHADILTATATTTTTSSIGACELASGGSLSPATTSATSATTTTTTVVATQNSRAASSDHVAIKIIPKMSDNEKDYSEYEKQMHNEAAIMKKVSSHAHIVNLIEFIEGERNFYMVLECCRHSCMKTIVDCHFSKQTDYKITEKSLSFILWQLLDALSYCHSMNIAHLDIKPDNILLGMDFQVRLCDFGLSVDNAPCYRNVHTWLFCPPEILIEKKAYCQSDCWAAGVVMFVLLSGFFPFHSMSGTLSELKKRITEGPTFILSKAPLSRDAKNLLSQLLDVNPKTRIKASDAMNHEWFHVANDDEVHQLHQTMIVNSLKQLSQAPPIDEKILKKGRRTPHGLTSPVLKEKVW